MRELYFNQFEDCKPYEPVNNNTFRTYLFQVSSILAIISGLIYFYWRWTYSLNYDYLGFSLILVTAETLSFSGIVLTIFDLWKNKDPEKKPAPHFLSEITNLDGKPDRPITIDVFITTINEDAELLRYTIKDTKALKYPFYDVKISIYLMDDGRRDGRDATKENLKKLCEEEKINYLTRENNRGYKAGNLKNAVDNSSGDLFVILDADTRPFPGFLENTSGYFRKQKVAWVQTLHWFYDTTKPVPLSNYMIKTFSVSSSKIKKTVEFFFSKIKTGEDIFGCDPRQFYEVIQRRRNNYNASFCCGAASIHRRTAVMETAIRQHEKFVNQKLKKIVKKKRIADKSEIEKIKAELISTTEVTPFVYHVSEDLYTSMIMHSDEKRWESVLHPAAECRMLSPQDIGTFMKQRKRYATGSMDIFFNDNPLLKRGLSFTQRICYFHSVWSFFSFSWVIIFLLSPILFLFFQIMPVKISIAEFFYFFIPFFTLCRISDIAGSWGISQKRPKQYYKSLFWVNFSAMMQIILGKKKIFTVTPKTKQKVNSFPYAWPHITLITLTSSGILFHIIMLFTGLADQWVPFLVTAYWGLNNCWALFAFVRAAYWNTEYSQSEKEAESVKNNFVESRKFDESYF